MLITITQSILLLLTLSYFLSPSIAVEFVYEKCLENNPPDGTEYDFIVVGAGATGSVVANRLSDHYSVLILEAGGPPHESIDVPRYAEATMFQSNWDWEYKSTPQTKSGLGFPGRRIELPRGKMLGGSSSHNGMYFIRGNSRDFDKWADLVEDEQWNYTNLLPFFKRTETYRGSFPTNEEYRGDSGPLIIKELNFRPMHEEWLIAGREANLTVDIDPSADQRSSFFEAQVNIDEHGRRSSAYEAYILPAMENDNFHLLCFAYATKVNINPETMSAESVTYARHSQLVTAKARKEIILSGGGYQSPQLLMLSGIGNSSYLSEHQIPTLVDLPAVGEGLQDHPAVLFGPFTLNNSYVPPVVSGPEVEEEYRVNGTGPLSSPLFSGAGIWSTTGDHAWPNLLVQLLPSYRLPYEGYADSQDEDWTAHSLSLVVNHGLPKSVGRVGLNSNNPFDNPLIDVNYFDVDDDLEVMVEGFKFGVSVIEGSSSFGGKYNATLWDKKLPQCQQHPSRSEAYYRCYLQHYARTGHHPTTTCRMGQNSSTSVVDTELRVHGVNRLRVADASVMPYITNANVHAPCFMIGEKAADFILKDWENGQEPIYTTPRVTTPRVTTTMATTSSTKQADSGVSCAMGASLATLSFGASVPLIYKCIAKIKA